MAPMKNDVEINKSEAKKSSLQSPLISLLPSSVDKGPKKVFKDLAQGCRDPLIPTSGWNLYWYFYRNRNDKVPTSNPWTLDVEKMIFPNAFVDIELIQALAQIYHAPTKTIRLPSGGCLVDVS
jgi:hypothetical protein